MKLETEDSDYTRIADQVLLEKVDKLFACNAGDLIDLPQLVVVGDQSSGKSSVLAGLTKLPFPRDSGLCTRFATQITFRRSEVKKIKVTIIPGANSSPEHGERVKSWGVTIEKLDAESFAKILAEVPTVMGISTQDEKGTSDLPTFTDDVLRLEISGPNEDHLSIIDVPGIFKNTTPGLTSKEDIHKVREIVLAYMRNPRSVMLTVVPANVDVATQEILEIAKELDPNGDRTLGVLTKPDLVDEGAESTILEILKGNTHGIKLGWNVVRNPGQRDLKDGKVDRHSEDRFFRDEAPWKTVEKDKVGVESLRTRLQNVLTDLIRREFPKVRSEINKRLRTSENAVKLLGAERSTRDQQRSFLIGVVERFKEATSQGLSGSYAGNHIPDGQANRRLANSLVAREEYFSDHILQWGQKYAFDDGEAPDPEGDVRNEPAKIGVRLTDSLPELEDFLHDQENMEEAKNDIVSWIESVYRWNRGFEIGTFSPSLLPAMFKEQSEKWKGFALGFISDAITTVHTFISDILKSACVDERVHLNLMSILMDDLVTRYKAALKQVEFLLDVEMTGFLRTLNHYFSDNLDKRRKERIKKDMESKAHGTVVQLDLVVQGSRSLSNLEFTVQELHDILEAYYKVSRKRFVDAVTMQGAHYHLLNGPQTPLNLLSPSYVQNLTDSQLEAIAGEDISLRSKRDRLKKEMADLEVARKILL